ncbi:hypothetical protein Tco_0679140 [Tanacetum coccineum]|uniref:Xylulose kinase-1 n=1 Tax=Tanacetum coccineum TaxID=301880 RepID=A0ABQ4XIC6_9ASTR
MTTLKFADSHNMVAFLTKSAESEGFEQIVDFLNANPIRYALTINPTIYASCIKQFWATVKMKTVNGEVQLQALVDGKKIIITEEAVRRDLQLEDAEGFLFSSMEIPYSYCFAMTTAWNEFSSTMAFAIICLATNQKFNFSKYIFESMVKNLDNAGKFLMYPRQGKDFSGRVTPLFPTMMVQAQEEMDEDEAVNEDPSIQLKELMDFCTKLQQRVIHLENTKTTQAQEITSLKLRVKKLEKKGGSRTYKLKRLYKVGRSARVVSFDEASLGDQEDASKQGRKIDDIDADARITLDSTYFDADTDMFGVHDLDGNEVVVESEVAAKKKDDEVNIVEEVVSAAEETVITATTATTKGILLQEPSESITTTTTKFPSKDKGKAIMVEEPLKMKKKDQISFNEQEAIRLQAEFDEEVRLVREKDEANVALIEEWNDIQAKIDVDYQMAIKCKQKNKKTEEKRNRPPTRAQQRSIMCTYLKNMAGWKPKDLKNKSFANIQELFENAMKRVNTFVDMDTKLVKGSEVRVEGSEVRAEGSETREESSSKRAGDKLEQEKAKKQKVDEDKETSELQSLMEVILGEEEVAVDAIPLATKPPSIVNWKILKEGNVSYYQIIRADGSSKRYSAFIQMLRSFDREDLETLWKLVKAKHGYTRPEEGYERVLWGDLKTMFEHHVEDTVWRNLQGNKVLVWKLFNSCGVHFVSFLSSSQSNSRINEVFGSILMVINEVFNEET